MLRKTDMSYFWNLFALKLRPKDLRVKLLLSLDVFICKLHKLCTC